MSSVNSALTAFFGVVTRGQTYLNLLYLLLSFPLGLFYFIFLVTGLSLGIGLVIIWIGLLILVAMFAAWYGLAAFERWLAMGLLREDIPPMVREDLSNLSLWGKFIATAKNPVTWKGLVYLLARFPLGMFIFIVVVTLVSISVSLIGAPFYYDQIQIPNNMTITIDGVHIARLWFIDTLGEAMILSLVGILIGLVSLHIFNGLAWVSAKFARLMLGNFSTAPAAPAAPSAPAKTTEPSAPADNTPSEAAPLLLS